MTTEYKRVEQGYRLLFERNPAGVVYTRLEGTTIDCNDAFARLLGYDGRSEILGRPAWDFYFHPSDQATILTELEADPGLVRREVCFRRKDGQPVWVLLHVSRVEGADGQTGLQAVCIDVTERKRLEEQLRQVQKMDAVGRLAGGVAHDFNNLLTIITGYSELMLCSLRPEEPFFGAVQMIRQTAERAANLTRQLLAFSRKQILRATVVHLNHVVHDMEGMLRRLLGEDVELVVALAPDLGSIRADRGYLEQVILNLALNARDAMPQGGRLTLQTSNVCLGSLAPAGDGELQPGAHVLLEVSDNGCGMGPETLAHLFEPFFTTKEPGKATGLGLATVYGIIKQSGGQIQVHSKPGAGTRFSIYLPRIEDPAATPAAAGGALATGRETVLLVEDEDDLRALACLVLQRHGYRVLEACGGEEALAVSERHPGPIDLLVTDVVMPHMNGRQLADRLLAARPSLHVLYISGYVEDETARRGVQSDSAFFLEKPFTPASLIRKVGEILSRQKG